MCNGGWPQNAYAYAMKHEGLPSEKSLSYDGDLLMILSAVKSGESDEMTEEQFDSYLSEMCPADNHGSSNRYGAITGYAYATDRCICYTDGTGCDCDNQNEALAVMNLASYGPATVCLEASTWQDYTGGIITSESGCSSAFLNMNHCVQAVGYAFVDVTDDDDANEEENSKSNKGKNESKTRREGYWIIRNQWSTYWGMNGYAYVAMGENTCGVLNDMTQVFMD
jgi:cathepsin F